MTFLLLFIPLLMPWNTDNQILMASEQFLKYMSIIIYVCLSALSLYAYLYYKSKLFLKHIMHIGTD